VVSIIGASLPSGPPRRSVSGNQAVVTRVEAP
jgi:hypothetical protein